MSTKGVTHLGIRSRRFTVIRFHLNFFVVGRTNILNLLDGTLFVRFGIGTCLCLAFSLLRVAFCIGGAFFLGNRYFLFGVLRSSTLASPSRFGGFGLLCCPCFLRFVLFDHCSCGSCRSQPSHCNLDCQNKQRHTRPVSILYIARAATYLPPLSLLYTV